MSAYLHISGNLGRDAESRQTQNGTSIVSFSVGVKIGFGDKAQTLWIDCSFFGKRAESVQPYLLKGTQVNVRGTPGLRTYEKNGQSNAVMTLNVDDVQLIGGKRDAQPAKQSVGKSMGDELDDSVPF